MSDNMIQHVLTINNEWLMIVNDALSWWMMVNYLVDEVIDDSVDAS